MDNNDYNSVQLRKNKTLQPGKDNNEFNKLSENALRDHVKSYQKTADWE